jgi:hypothetical protein
MNKTLKISSDPIDKTNNLVYNTSMKNKTNNHVRINNIDFNYVAGWNVLIVTYPNGQCDTIIGLTKLQADKKVGIILKKERVCS